ncbi:uncharacterized protein LOC132571205 isoform X2 [Heteronotia binoei]|uniref:uncharacterized protein LOC132571205 isoform X2 n=1 Tax=Heteronotia binoei TaxID=13085 RepID=UPI0029304C54|nr:uncharacterized protein LOC132571205 isoform X2 [Heteronotia binoei]XP_060093903.1 uncharacterized protein LOC132571205 isoform X2 [Heteronotia binoei]XP_060093905.1 uncharacterized protein LOC132571205 isoform X2 [Heteronotia binoei]
MAMLEEEPFIQIKLEEEPFLTGGVEDRSPIRIKEEDGLYIQIKTEEEPFAQIKVEEGQSLQVKQEQQIVQIKLGDEIYDQDPQKSGANKFSGIFYRQGPQAAHPEEGSQVHPDFTPAIPTAQQPGGPADKGPMVPPAKLPATTPLASFRNRRRQVASLSDVAKKILEQEKSQYAEAMRQMDAEIQWEERKFQMMREERERDRKAFQECMQKTTAVMEVAVELQRNLVSWFQNTQRFTPAQERGLPCPSQAPAALEQFRSSCENRGSNTLREEPQSVTQAPSGLLATRSKVRGKRRSRVGRKRAYLEP